MYHLCTLLPSKFILRKHFPVLCFLISDANVIIANCTILLWTCHFANQTSQYNCPNYQYNLHKITIIVYVNKVFSFQWSITHSNVVIMNTNWACYCMSKLVLFSCIFIKRVRFMEYGHESCDSLCCFVVWREKETPHFVYGRSVFN